jgi:hypothetical protein
MAEAANWFLLSFFHASHYPMEMRAYNEIQINI